MLRTGGPNQCLMSGLYLQEACGQRHKIGTKIGVYSGMFEAVDVSPFRRVVYCIFSCIYSLPYAFPVYLGHYNARNTKVACSWFVLA